MIASGVDGVLIVLYVREKYREHKIIGSVTSLKFSVSLLIIPQILIYIIIYSILSALQLQYKQYQEYYKSIIAYAEDIVL